MTQSDAPEAPSGVHATRRCGARHEISARVTLRTPPSFATPPAAPSSRGAAPARRSDSGRPPGEDDSGHAPSSQGGVPSSKSLAASAPDSASERVTVPETPDAPSSGAGDGPSSAAPDAPSSGSSVGQPRTLGIEGWALNVSRGGVRVILEVRVELGTEYEVTISQGAHGELSETRVGRVVWLQDEPDGVVAGIEFVSLSLLPGPPQA